MSVLSPRAEARKARFNEHAEWVGIVRSNWAMRHDRSHRAIIRYALRAAKGLTT